MVDLSWFFSVVKNYVIPTLISLGIVAIYLKFYYEKKIKSYDLKLNKYLEIAVPIAKMYGVVEV